MLRNDVDCPTNRYANGNPNEHTNGNSYTYGYRNRDRSANGNPDEHGHGNCNVDDPTHGNSGDYRDRNRDGHFKRNAHSIGDSNEFTDELSFRAANQLTYGGKHPGRRFTDDRAHVGDGLDHGGQPQRTPTAG